MQPVVYARFGKYTLAMAPLTNPCCGFPASLETSLLTADRGREAKIHVDGEDVATVETRIRELIESSKTA